MRKPTVSIVTPSYNQGRFIRATIESVLSQDYPNIEYIVMDGGSTDETASVVKEYSSRLKFISEKDRGQSHAINKGFKMASGEILAWLNSDDVYLPGCVRTSVETFQANPNCGAVYGEGYLIDFDGNRTSRFPCTEPFNLWKLLNLSDYILQQSLYFRRTALDDVGYIDENLHYTMDWDILIRIGMKYHLANSPNYMGCLREYPAAKSFAGGMERIREIRDLLRKHTGKFLPPGYIVYGLDSWHQIACRFIEDSTPGPLKLIGSILQSSVRLSAGMVIARTLRESQGLHADGWVSPRLNYMLPPGTGIVSIRGEVPDWGELHGQRLHVFAQGRRLNSCDVGPGVFDLRLLLPDEMLGQLLSLQINAVRSFIPGRLNPRGDRRKLSYLLHGIQWAENTST